MRTILLSTLLCGLAAAAAPARAQAPAVTDLAPEPPCEAMARAAYSAALAGAESGFWLDVARAVNEPGSGLAGRLRDAWVARREARGDALAQYEGRLRICAELGHGSYAPVLAPARFTAQVDALLFPLPPGRTWIYEAETALGLDRIETRALAEARVVGGVPCRTVLSEEYHDGALKERTVEWFSQDADGSVWYLGEITQEFEDGLPVTMDGSWRAGVESALAGVQLPCAPRIGDVWRMEFQLGAAEDVARVVAVDQIVSVPAGVFDGCVAVREWSPLDPRELVMKYYSPKVGLVLEVDERTGARMELIELR